MFNEHQPNEHQPEKRELDLKLPLMVIACAGGGVLLSFGLCGTAAAIPAARLSRISAAGFYLFFLSILTIIVGCFWMLIAAIINAVRK